MTVSRNFILELDYCTVSKQNISNCERVNKKCFVEKLTKKKPECEYFHEYSYFSDDNLHYNISYKGQVLCMTVSSEDSIGLYKENGTFNQIHYNWGDKTILIAEDEEANFLYLKTALSRTGVKIIRAKTGKEAVDRVKENEDIDLVLMDIKMPEMNGIDATKEIKALNNNIKVIAQTAYAMEEDRILYFNAGCIDYLEKPIKRDLLLTVISKHI
jgi:CheY-like chemotaxis protein